LHAALGHEIGHVLSKEYLASQQQKDYVQLANEVLQWIAQDPASGPATEGGAEEYFTMCCDLRNAAINEIVADLYAIQCFGPAAFFSLHEMAQQYAMDESPIEARFYPPWRLRLRYAARALSEYSYLPIRGVDDRDAEVLAAEVARLTSEAEDTTYDNEWSQNVITIAYQSVERSISSIHQFLREKVVSTAVSPEMLYGQTRALVDRLLQQLPPCGNETDPTSPKPATLPAILNAAWFYRLLRISKIKQETADWQKEYLDEMEIVQRLTLRAIETSYWQKEFRNAQTRIHN